MCIYFVTWHSAKLHTYTFNLVNPSGFISSNSFISVSNRSCAELDRKSRPLVTAAMSDWQEAKSSYGIFSFMNWVFFFWDDCFLLVMVPASAKTNWYSCVSQSSDRLFTSSSRVLTKLPRVCVATARKAGRLPYATRIEHTLVEQRFYSAGDPHTFAARQIWKFGEVFFKKNIHFTGPWDWPYNNCKAWTKNEIENFSRELWMQFETCLSGEGFWLVRESVWRAFPPPVLDCWFPQEGLQAETCEVLHDDQTTRKGFLIIFFCNSRFYFPNRLP